MDKYIVKMTLEQWVEAQDEDDAVEIAKLNFDYSDLHYADIEVEENCDEEDMAEETIHRSRCDGVRHVC